MKIFNKIVWSSKEPSNHNDVWFDGSTFQIYNNGTWESITLEIEAAEKVAEAIKDVSNVYQEKLIQGNSITIKNNIISAIVDSALSLTSTNPIQNKTVTTELNKKANKTEIPTKLSQLEMDIEVGSDYDDTELREKINKKVESIVVTTTEPTAEFPQVLYTPQTLTEEQKAQARKNIGVNQNEGGDSSVIPDWNASEEEVGFIKNRTHYHDFIVKANVDITNTRAGEVINLGFYVNSNTKVRNTITGGIKSVPVDEEFYLPTQGPSVRAKIVNTTASQLHILSSNSGVPNILEFGQEIIQPLDDKFISDSIARTSEIPTKLSQLEKDIEVDSDYDDTEIRDAIESIDRKIVELEQDIEGIDRISIDENLSVASTNPVQNKVITAELEKKLEEVDVKQLISREHLYYKYVSAENKVYFKGILPAYQDWTLLNVYAVNYAVGNPVTVHMLIEDEGGYIRVSTNKFDLITNQRDVFGLFWIYGDLKYSATFDEKNNQVITTEPYNEGEGSSAIPDWNASEGEDGFIKNKTHGYKKYITVRAGKNIRNDYNGQKEFLYALDGKIYTLNRSYPTKTTIGEGDTEAIVAFDFASQTTISVTPVGANTQNVDVYGWLLEDDIYEPLADGFIPNTIARTEQLTELSSEVSGLSERVDALGQPIFKAVFNTTTYNEIIEAENQGKWVICEYENSIYHLSTIKDGAVWFGTADGDTSKRLWCYSTNKWYRANYTLELISNKTTTINESSTDTQYPSAKAVYDFVNNAIGNVINGDY